VSGVLLHLLLDYDRATVVGELTGLYGERLRNSHAGRCEQNVQRLLLTTAGLNKFRDCFRLERWTLLFSILNDGQIHSFRVPFPVMDRFAIWTLQGFHVWCAKTPSVLYLM
jgi:hypothetical protein